MNTHMYLHNVMSGVADEFGMDDEDYDFVDRLEVQEDNGTW